MYTSRGGPPKSHPPQSPLSPRRYFCPSAVLLFILDAIGRSCDTFLGRDACTVLYALRVGLVCTFAAFHVSLERLVSVRSRCGDKKARESELSLVATFLGEGGKGVSYDWGCTLQTHVTTQLACALFRSVI